MELGQSVCCGRFRTIATRRSSLDTNRQCGADRRHFSVKCAPPAWRKGGMISSSFYKFAATTKVAFTSKHRFNWLISGAVRRPLRSSRSIDKTDHVTVQFVVFRNQGQVTNGWPLPGQICFRSHTISSFRTAAQTPFVSKWPAGCRRVINLNYQNRTNQVNKMLLRKRVRIVFGKLKFQLEKLY